MIIKEGPDSVRTYSTWVKAYNDGLQAMIDDFESTHIGVSCHLSVVAFLTKLTCL